MRIRTMVATATVVASVLVSAVIGFAPAASAAPSSTHVQQGACLPAGRDDTWPDWANGKPAGLDAGDNGGVYLWHDTEGWHLVVTHKTDDKRVFSGVLHTSGRFVDVHGVALEANDKLVPDGHTIRFRFRNYGHVDGLTFKTLCAPSIEASFTADGHRLPSNRIVVGHTDRHPDHDPFVMNRTA